MTDADRLWRRLHEVSEIGRADGGGVTRLSFTDQERTAKDLVVLVAVSLATRGVTVTSREQSA